MGEASIIAAELGVPVVADFRTADLALGGQGAPLVPLLDYVAFHHPTRNRVLQNLGGIANVTVIPAGAPPEAVFAFDTGPANMVIDALMTECFGKKYDAQGATAKRGRVLESVLEHHLRGRFFLSLTKICRQRRIWTRICRAISGGVPQAEQAAGGCGCDRNSADGTKHRARMEGFYCARSA